MDRGDAGGGGCGRRVAGGGRVAAANNTAGAGGRVREKASKVIKEMSDKAGFGLKMTTSV